MSGDLLSRWVRKYNEKMSGADAFPGKGKLSPYDKERFDLKKEIARVTRERDILKKPWDILPAKRSKIFFYKKA
ncbi:MAG: hypothetical protein PG981_000555 [Wolbachia endosymbiont of Ctenocephalides orientis wCori]|nr:MAG: hypothetical protein PG981_000555 [Wolbachia endosymbiont of Ctenocephalides orientis wCori]